MIGILASIVDTGQTQTQCMFNYLKAKYTVVADEGVVEAFCGINVGVLEVDELDFGVGDGKTPVEVRGDEGIFGAPVEPVGAGLLPAGFEVGHDGVPEGVDEIVGGDPVVVLWIQTRVKFFMLGHRFRITLGPSSKKCWKKHSSCLVRLKMMSTVIEDRKSVV